MGTAAEPAVERAARAAGAARGARAEVPVDRAATAATAATVGWGAMEVMRAATAAGPAVEGEARSSLRCCRRVPGRRARSE